MITFKKPKRMYNLKANSWLSNDLPSKVKVTKTNTKINVDSIFMLVIILI